MHARFMKRGAGFLLGLVILLIMTACNLPAGTALAPSQKDIPALKPVPEITSLTVEDNCNIRINYVDHVPPEGIYAFLKRSVGGSDQYHYVQVANKHGEVPASFLDNGLPAGTYSYEVGYYDSTDFYHGVKSASVVLDASCGDEPLVNKPFNPIVTSVEVTGICTAHIWGDVFSPNLDGVRVYRSIAGADYVRIAELSVHDWLGQNDNNQWVSAARKYDDKNLHSGTYHYKLSAFNADSEVFSEPSAEVQITDAICNPKLENVPTVPVAVTQAPTLLPLPAPAACTWEAALNVFVRKGPGASRYPDITGVVPGTQFPIIGQSQDGQFWVVAVKPGLNGYVPKAEKFSRTSGDCANQPTLPDPPVPPTAVPTSQPQCSDGIDNDGDRLVDLFDPGCTSAGDNSER